MEKINNISAYIIAGGKSKRFGSDKSQYIYKKKPLIQHVYDALQPVFSDIYVVSNSEDVLKLPGIITIEDLIPNLGPIGGIYTALKHTKNQAIFVSACDMPHLNSDFIRFISTFSSDFDGVIPFFGGFYEALHSIYSIKCLQPVKELIDSGDRKIINLYEKIHIKAITEEDITGFDNPERMFHNINYFKDLKKHENIKK